MEVEEKPQLKERLLLKKINFIYNMFNTQSIS